MKNHNIYLFRQVFSDGRTMIARWSPTIDRRHIKPFHSQADELANDYLKYYGFPEIEAGEEPRLIPALPFEVIGVNDDARS